MIEKISGNIIKINNTNIFVSLNNNITIKIQILLNTIKNYQINQQISLDVYFDYKNFEIYGFEFGKQKEIFILLLQINSLGPKTAQKILNNFLISDLIEIFKNYEIERLSKNINLKIDMCKKIIEHFNKNYFKINFTIITKKLINTLIKLGYKTDYVYRVVIKNNDLINNTKFSFEFLLKKIILELSTLNC